MQVTAAVGLGANLGNAADTLLQARERLRELPQTAELAFSSLYASAPVDASGPEYVNAVQLLHTALPARLLLDNLLVIEKRHGRKRPYPNAPRTLDLDLLLYGDQVLHSAHLQLPHPRLHLRAFVLLPLLEVWPEASIPGLGMVRDLLPGAAGQTIRKLNA
jgi:2-amino-4-hydroxy-6-hydroxymethyldihydropteridine diphosphokinase